GVAHVPGQQQAWNEVIQRAGIEGIEVSRAGSKTLLQRRGALAGTADFVSQPMIAKKHGTNLEKLKALLSQDPQAIRRQHYVPDKVAKGPFGVLWYGDTLPNGGEAPVPSVIGGILHYSEFTSSKGSSPRLVDAYTGRVLGS